MGEFRMPSLGAEMESGRLLTWYVEPGQRVRRGDVIALVETDKADIDVEVFEDGVVEELLVEEGTKVPVGTPLAHIGDADTTERPPVTAPAPTVAPEPTPAPTVAPEPSAAPVRAAPVAEPVSAGQPAALLNPVLRRLARELGVDPATIEGSGPAGGITRADVEKAASLVSPEPPIPGDLPRPPDGERAGRSSPYARRLAAERGLDPTTLTGSGPRGALVAGDVPVAGQAVPAQTGVPPTRTETPAEPKAEAPGRAADDRYQAMRRAIARAMARSNREIPHYYLGEQVDMEPALAWLTDHNAGLPASERLLPAVLLLKAVALSLVDFPDLNGFWEDDAFRAGDGVHVGVAISLRRGGLLAPAIRDADDKTLSELMGALRDLVVRTRSGGLRGSELSDGTITVTNLGDTGVETVYGVIQSPQVALVGAGAITERPWASEGMVGSRRCIHLTLAADHRASDGHRGGLFLASIATRLREPETL